MIEKPQDTANSAANAWENFYKLACEFGRDINHYADAVADVLDHDAAIRTSLSANVALATARAALDDISGLCSALRQGGPDPMDLQGLSDALAEAVDIAQAVFHETELDVQPIGGEVEPTVGGDGCYCTHHLDDPAHGSQCYAPTPTEPVAAPSGPVALAADYTSEAERTAVKAGEVAAMEYSGGRIGVFLSGLTAYRRALYASPNPGVSK